MGRSPTAAHSRRLHCRSRQEILYDSGTYTQILKAWDAYDTYDEDTRTNLVVDPNGSERFERLP
jgi:hypothetical protein